MLQQVDSSQVMQEASTELSSIKEKLKSYHDVTHQKFENSKYSMALGHLQQASDLTELTQLALKITEEMKRAQIVASQNPVADMTDQ